MNIVTAIWCNNNQDEIEKNFGLEFIGKHYQKLGIKLSTKLIFLSGMEKLEERYKSMLTDLGYSFIDASILFNQIAKQYSNLKIFGDYELFCFLRWLVFEKILEGEPFLHLDADIILNEHPQNFLNKVTGMTFVVQGCPAFSLINNHDWFLVYNQALNKLQSDVNGYSAQAWIERASWEITCNTHWAGTRYRRIISSDQDLISHLIHTKQLPQSPVVKIKIAWKDYLIYDSPLIFQYHSSILPLKYQRLNGLDFFSYNRVDMPDDKFTSQILFWHMHSYFTNYLAQFLSREKIWGRFARKIRLTSPLDEKHKKSWQKGLFVTTDRLQVYKRFFERGDFSAIFNKHVWWQEGVFR
jgi:hypothetical protein